MGAYFHKQGHGPEFDVERTNNWRGYIATWSIYKDHLYLISIHASVAKKKFTLADLFPGAEKSIKAVWYSGTLILPQGKIISFRHQGNKSIYEKELQIKIKNGRVIEEKIIKNSSVLVPFRDKESSGLTMEIQNDGKLIVAGKTKLKTDQQAFVARLNPDGAIDREFSNNGMLTMSFPKRSNFFDIALQEDGNILAVGTHSKEKYQHALIVIRTDSKGKLDTSFGKNGIVQYQGDNSTLDVGLSCKVQKDGKIVIAGWTIQDELHKLKILRFHVNGELDNTFGSHGQIIFSRGKDDYAASLTLQKDNKILVAGRSNNGENIDGMILRYMPDGKPDLEFGDNGIVILDDGADEQLNDIIGLSNGSIMAVGQKEQDKSSRLILVRLNASGKFDNSFGKNGFLLPNLNASRIQGQILRVVNGEFICVAGSISTKYYIDALFLKFDIKGTLLKKWTLSQTRKINQTGIALATGLVVTKDLKLYISGWYTKYNRTKLFLAQPE